MVITSMYFGYQKIISIHLNLSFFGMYNAIVSTAPYWSIGFAILTGADNTGVRVDAVSAGRN